MEDILLSIGISTKEIEASLHFIKDILVEVVKQANEPINFITETTEAELAINNFDNEINKIYEKAEKPIEFSVDVQSAISSLGQFGLALNAVQSIFNGMTRSFASFVNASNDQEKHSNTLVSALRTLGQATQENIKGYHDFASAIQNVTTIGDEQVLKLLAQSVTMGIVEDKRQEATKGAIGLAKAFEAAGLSQETAMKGVALAYQGNFTQLQRYIPALRDAIDETEKMAILQQAMANGFQMAQDETTTAMGTMQQFDNVVGDLKEHIGDLVKSVHVLFVEALLPVTEFLNKNATLMKSVVGVVGGLTISIAVLKAGLLAKMTVMSAMLPIMAAYKTAIIGVTGAKKIWIAIQSALNVALSANPIGVIIMAVAALGAAIGAIIKHFKNKKKALEETTESMTDYNDAIEQATKKGKEYFVSEIELLNLKRQNNIEVTESLRKMHHDFTQYLYGLYGEDSIAYQQALRDKLAFEKEISDQSLQNQKDIIKAKLDFEHQIAMRDDPLRAKYAQQIRDTNSFYDERKELLIQAGFTEKQIKEQQMLALKDLENEYLLEIDNMNKVAIANRQKAKEDFEQAVATLKNPEKAKFDQQIKDTRAFYESRKDLLIEAGLSAIEYENQLNNAIQSIENTYMESRIQNLKLANDEIVAARQKRVDEEKNIERAMWEFEQESLMLDDPFHARLNHQIRLLESFYESRKSLLLRAGYTEEDINSQIAKSILDLEEQNMKQRLQSYSAGLAQMADNLKNFGTIGFKASQLLQIAQVMIDTPVAAMAAYKSLVGIPVIGPALATVAFGATVAVGAKQVSEIKKQQPPQFKQGGFLQGPSHNKGGIFIEAEGEEYITNKKRVKELGVDFFDFLNFAPIEKIKSVFGKIVIPPVFNTPIPSPVMALGGSVSTPMIANNSFDFLTIKDALVQEIRNLKSSFDNKELVVNNFISANEVLKKADKTLVNVLNEEGKILRNVF